MAASDRVLYPMSGGNLVLRWSHFDFRGSWCIGKSDSKTIVGLMERIKGFESMPPVQIFGTTKTYLGTDYDLPDPRLCKAATERLMDLHFGDETRISALRISSRGRLFGFRRDPEFYAVFWDPEHQIYPSGKKHT